MVQFAAHLTFSWFSEHIPNSISGSQLGCTAACALNRKLWGVRHCEQLPQTSICNFCHQNLQPLTTHRSQLKPHSVQIVERLSQENAMEGHMKLCPTLSSCHGPPHVVSKTTSLPTSLLSKFHWSFAVLCCWLQRCHIVHCVKISTCLITAPTLKSLISEEGAVASKLWSELLAELELSNLPSGLGGHVIFKLSQVIVVVRPVLVHS